MKFRIDRKYIAVQMLKAVAGYLVGLGIVLCFRGFKDVWDIIIPSFCAGLTLFLIFWVPRKIYVKDGVVSFTKENNYERTNVTENNIAKVETMSKFYNTLTLTTKSGESYKLHPADPQSLESMILPRK